MNHDDLRQSIVRIDAGEGHGTGFVVGPGAILTCHHVISGAARVTVSAGGGSFPVEEVVFPPMRGSRPVFDLALLRADVPQVPPVDLDGLPPEPGDELMTFGFTDQYPEGDSALFVFEGLSVEQHEPLFRLKLAQARPGLSGAPLLSRRRGGVVGVVSRTRGRDSDLGARAVPIEAATRLSPGLADRMTTTDTAAGERAHLVSLMAIHERNVRLLEAQVAGYGPLNVPAYKQNELDHERAELASLRSRLGGP